MSERAKHTPGPWVAAYEGRFFCEDCHSEDERGQNGQVWLWSVSHPTAPNTFLGVAQIRGHEDDEEANACLIAAAPRLLDAAKLAVENFERHSASGNFLGDDDHEAWTALASAVEEAEGR